MTKQQFPVTIQVAVTQEDGMFVGKPSITCQFQPMPVVNFPAVIYAASQQGVFEIASACMSVRSIRGSLKVVAAKTESERIIADATSAIIGAASRNKNITAAQMRDELEHGMIEGWLGLAAVRECNLSQWSAAMYEASKTIQALEDLGV